VGEAPRSLIARRRFSRLEIIRRERGGQESWSVTKEVTPEAAHVVARDLGAQRQVLARLEAEELAQRIGHVERDGDRVACFALDLQHRQRMKLAHAGVAAVSAA